MSRSLSVSFFVSLSISLCLYISISLSLSYSLLSHSYSCLEYNVRKVEGLEGGWVYQSTDKRSLLLAPVFLFSPKNLNLLAWVRVSWRLEFGSVLKLSNPVQNFWSSKSNGLEVDNRHRQEILAVQQFRVGQVESIGSGSFFSGGLILFFTSNSTLLIYKVLTRKGGIK